MRQSRETLETEIEYLKHQNTSQAICLKALLSNKVQWLRKGRGETRVEWGLARLDGPSGGYVIRRSHGNTECLLLDHAIKFAQQIGFSASTYTGNDRAIVDHEFEISNQASVIRNEALRIKYPSAID